MSPPSAEPIDDIGDELQEDSQIVQEGLKEPEDDQIISMEHSDDLVDMGGRPDPIEESEVVDSSAPAHQQPAVELPQDDEDEDEGIDDYYDQASEKPEVMDDEEEELPLPDASDSRVPESYQLDESVPLPRNQPIEESEVMPEEEEP